MILPCPLSQWWVSCGDLRDGHFGLCIFVVHHCRTSPGFCVLRVVGLTSLLKEKGLKSCHCFLERAFNLIIKDHLPRCVVGWHFIC